MARSRDISKVLSSNSTLATDAEVAATYQTKTTAGLTLLIPSSITATGGSGSIGSNGTVSFTSASAVSLNGIFNSTYDNYQIIVDYVCVDEAALLMRLRVSGSDNTSANYGMARWNFRSGGTGATGGFTQTEWIVGGSGNTRKANATINVFSPFLSTNTSFNSLTANSNTTQMYGDVLMGNTSVTTSYTGCTLYVGNLTTTGTVSVYGYNK